MNADGKIFQAAPTPPYVLMFDVKRHDASYVPICSLLSPAKATDKMKAFPWTPLVPPDAVLEEGDVPWVMASQRFMRSGSAFQKVPAYDARVMKVIRDLLVDMYTGKPLTEAIATNDHVIPRSFGFDGRTRWTNQTTTAYAVNHRKRDRLPEQCGLNLLMKPWRPTYADILHLYRYAYHEQIGNDLHPAVRLGAIRDEVWQTMELKQNSGMGLAA